MFMKVIHKLSNKQSECSQSFPITYGKVIYINKTIIIVMY